MIKCNLSTLMGEHKMKVQDVCNETKLARNTVSNLYNERATRIDFSTIERLCKLFQCGVGELIEYVSED